MSVIGFPSAGTRSAVLLNAIEYPIHGEVVTETRDITPDAPHEVAYRLNEWSGGVGARRAGSGGNPRPGMVYDATARTQLPGGITPGLLIQPATLSGTPTQESLITCVGEVNSILNFYGIVDNAGTRSFGRWEWDGATETFTRTAIAATGTALSTSKMGRNTAKIGATLYQIGLGVTGGNARNVIISSTDGTTHALTWHTTLSGVLNTWVAGKPSSTTFYWMADDGSSNIIVYSTFDPASTESTFTGKGGKGKDLLSWLYQSGTATSEAIYALLTDGLYYIDETANAPLLVHKFEGVNANCAFTNGNIIFIGYGDKGAVRSLEWDGQGGIIVREWGMDSPTMADGLPADSTGPVVKLGLSPNGWLRALVSGDAAGIYTSVYERELREGVGWHRVMRAATANQSASQFAVSATDDNVSRTHVAVEASGTVDALYFVNESGTLEYENGTQVTFPEIVFSNTRGASAVTEATVYADGLDATETITLAFDPNGAGSFTDFAAFGAASTLPATPDAGVTMNRAIPRITFARSGTTTDHATYRDLMFKVLLKGGLLRTHTFTIDLLRACYTTGTTTVEGNRANVFALTKTGGLQTFQRDTDIDSTALRVYTARARALVDSYARGAGSIITRVDKNHMMTITVTEAIGS